MVQTWLRPHRVGPTATTCWEASVLKNPLRNGPRPVSDRPIFWHIPRFRVITWRLRIVSRTKGGWLERPALSSASQEITGSALILDRIAEIPKLVTELYQITDRLESLFPGRRFTPDGHLVGSIGEVLAADRYDLQLLPASSETHDATTRDGLSVQIKATQGRGIAIRSEPQHLLVLKICRDGSVEEAYNGPGNLPWEHAGKMQKNGQRPISLSRLKRLMEDVDEASRLPLRSEPQDHDNPAIQ